MKCIIYNMNTCEIVRIVEKTPRLMDLKDNEDCDTYKGWMQNKETAERIRKFELLNNID